LWICSNFFCTSSKITHNVLLCFVISVVTKKAENTILFSLLFCWCCWIRHQRSRIRDTGFGMGKYQDPRFGIWNKHPGSSKVECN
jgi:hypothetical protein